MNQILVEHLIFNDGKVTFTFDTNSQKIEIYLFDKFGRVDSSIPITKTENVKKVVSFFGTVGGLFND